MKSWPIRLLGILLSILLCIPPDAVAASGADPQNAASVSSETQPSQSPSPEEVAGNALPDSPGATRASLQSDQQSQPAEPGNQQVGQDKKPDSTTEQQPAGAAAAEAGKTTGGAASKPAGAALAPAKQKQSRSLALKLGLLAGAGIALGTITALSIGSTGRPPGSH